MRADAPVGASGIHIERADSDAALIGIAGMARSIWQAHYPAMISQAQIDYMLAQGYALPRMRREITLLGIRYWLAWQDQQAAGYCAAGLDEREPGFWLHKLYVSAAWRRQGLGRELLQTAINYACARDEQRLWLRVNRDNQLAVTAYRRMNFVIDRCDVKDIGSGFVMDDYIMCRSL